MELENTRKRFRKRIEFERKIITLINSISDTESPLTGLSDAAILSWKQKSSLPLKQEIAEKISSFSQALMIFCDNSRNAFDAGKRIDSKDMAKEIESLNLYLKEISQN